jgi:hypothetical protein
MDAGLILDIASELRNETPDVRKLFKKVRNAVAQSERNFPAGLKKGQFVHNTFNTTLYSSLKLMLEPFPDPGEDCSEEEMGERELHLDLAAQIRALFDSSYASEDCGEPMRHICSLSERHKSSFVSKGTVKYEKGKTVYGEDGRPIIVGEGKPTDLKDALGQHQMKAMDALAELPFFAQFPLWLASMELIIEDYASDLGVKPTDITSAMLEVKAGDSEVFREAKETIRGATDSIDRIWVTSKNIVAAAELLTTVPDWFRDIVDDWAPSVVDQVVGLGDDMLDVWASRLEAAKIVPQSVEETTLDVTTL